MKTPVQETKALQIQTDKVSIKATDNIGYAIVIGAVVVLCFFIYVKYWKNKRKHK